MHGRYFGAETVVGAGGGDRPSHSSRLQRARPRWPQPLPQPVARSTCSRLPSPARAPRAVHRRMVSAWWAAAVAVPAVVLKAAGGKDRAAPPPPSADELLADRCGRGGRGGGRAGSNRCRAGAGGAGGKREAGPRAPSGALSKLPAHHCRSSSCPPSLLLCLQACRRHGRRVLRVRARLHVAPLVAAHGGPVQGPRPIELWEVGAGWRRRTAWPSAGVGRAHRCRPTSPPVARLSQDPTPSTCVTVCGVSGALQGQGCGEGGQWANATPPAAAQHAATPATPPPHPPPKLVADDSCAEACQRAVCANMHQVPAWNDACLKRCATECARGRTRD